MSPTPIADDLAELASLHGDEQRIAAWLAARGLKLYPSRPAAGCPALRRGELECRNGWHTLAGGAVCRCGMFRYREQRRALLAQLELCGYLRDQDADAVDIAPALLARVDARRPVQGLDRLIALAHDAATEPLRAHTALLGSCGTAKTQVLLAVYFAALRRGTMAVWLTSGRLREVAQDLDSFDLVARARAQQQRRAWGRFELVVIDDLGDRKHAAAGEPGSTTLAGLILDVVSAGPALAWSSNLDSTRLRAHPDVGERVVSRLFADRGPHPARVVRLDGRDQRHHALRQQAAGGSP